MIIDRMPDARLHYEPSQDVARGPAATQDEEVHAVAGSINRLFVCARNTIRPQREEIVRRVLHDTHGRQIRDSTLRVEVVLGQIGSACLAFCGLGGSLPISIRLAGEAPSWVAASR